MSGHGNDGADGGDFGVSAGAPASLLEIMGDEDQAIEDARPFRSVPSPVDRRTRKGSPNKRTIEMRELYLKSGFPHPLLWQGSMLRLGVDGLARALGCDLVEAAELLRKIANDAAPYLESKMPTKVELPNDALPVLVVRELEGAALRLGRAAGALAIDDDMTEALNESERNQELKARALEGSHGEGSHGAEQAADPAKQSEP